ncbi:MAG: GFA family protein [Candidatus Thiodiazotropha lotti]|uniref:Aldehyde-activating protein n=1 Tax=Candidatus Thiodiazotropha endoloripes TaxID=1818881 RepID=A0A1E2UNU9_9GAMM|nr:GFA family protein [Candidatus Thiodiazotropha endoloripes]MCG7898355.1 GFA family protein [Candidatus Thiodiazotropha weberae]MCG7993434.1 GFA family protein [Candidatus Thiodiazotropha lotti]MCG7901104.1 GFA family protein [Candidatus Thiodiazotropha weberae]MCG7913296.1 GFA family protein [Candidatus Thiodiazotropha weberae]MCG7998048.1 GFA family protein [Candidatus Thiodiazotropha lotti]
MAITGSCACGEVTYKIDGELHDAAACHCSMCRKASGSQSSAFALIEPGKLSWLSGEALLTHYQSSEAMGNFFCSRCGSPLAGTYQGVIGWVSLGSVDGEPGVKVEKHVFMGSKAAWETSPGDVLQFDEYAD